MPRQWRRGDTRRSGQAVPPRVQRSGFARPPELSQKARPEGPNGQRGSPKRPYPPCRAPAGRKQLAAGQTPCATRESCSIWRIAQVSLWACRAEAGAIESRLGLEARIRGSNSVRAEIDRSLQCYRQPAQHACPHRASQRLELRKSSQKLLTGATSDTTHPSDQSERAVSLGHACLHKHLHVALLFSSTLAPMAEGLRDASTTISNRLRPRTADPCHFYRCAHMACVSVSHMAYALAAPHKVSRNYLQKRPRTNDNQGDTDTKQGVGIELGRHTCSRCNHALSEIPTAPETYCSLHTRQLTNS